MKEVIYENRISDCLLMRIELLQNIFACERKMYDKYTSMTCTTNIQI